MHDVLAEGQWYFINGKGYDCTFSRFVHLSVLTFVWPFAALNKTDNFSEIAI